MTQFTQQIHNQFNQGLFLFRMGFSNQKRQCCKPRVIDHRLVVIKEQAAVAVQKIHKQKRTAAFVTVGKRVVFHHKIKQVGGFAFNGG